MKSAQVHQARIHTKFCAHKAHKPSDPSSDPNYDTLKKKKKKHVVMSTVCIFLDLDRIIPL